MARVGEDKTTPEVTTPASPGPGTWFRWRWLAPWSPPGFLLLLFLTAGGFDLLVSRQVSPPDWVDLKIAPLPESCRALFILAERDGHIEALPPYVSKVTASPLWANYPTGVLGFHFGNAPDALSVQWKRGDRYGVLMRFQGRDDLERFTIDWRTIRRESSVANPGGRRKDPLQLPLRTGGESNFPPVRRGDRGGVLNETPCATQS